MSMCVWHGGLCVINNVNLNRLLDYHSEYSAYSTFYSPSKASSWAKSTMCHLIVPEPAVRQSQADSPALFPELSVALNERLKGVKQKTPQKTPNITITLSFNYFY